MEQDLLEVQEAEAVVEWAILVQVLVQQESVYVPSVGLLFLIRQVSLVIK